jgi:hypothetical protein
MVFFWCLGIERVTIFGHRHPKITDFLQLIANFLPPERFPNGWVLDGASLPLSLSF